MIPGDPTARAGAQRGVLVVVIAEVCRGAVSIGGIGRVVNLDHPARATTGDRDPVVVAAPVSYRRVHQLGAVRVADLVDIVRGAGRGGRVERAGSEGIAISAVGAPTLSPHEGESRTSELAERGAQLAAGLAQ